MNEGVLAVMNVANYDSQIIMQEIAKLKSNLNPKNVDLYPNLNKNQENNPNVINTGKPYNIENTNKLVNKARGLGESQPNNNPYEDLKKPSNQNQEFNGTNDPGEFTFHVNDPPKMPNINIPHLNPPNFGKIGIQNPIIPKNQEIPNQTFPLIFLKELGIKSSNEYIIKEKGETIGSYSEVCSIEIPNEGISKRHCTISYSQGNPFIQDLGSLNGTFLRLKNQIKLSEGLILRIGYTDFTVIKVENQNCTINTNWNGTNKQWLVNVYSTTIGRGKNNTISIPCDNIMSMKHARIWWDKGSFYLEDEGSEAKTWIRLSQELQPSKAFRLYFNDEIRIADIIFLIKIVTSPHQAYINGKLVFLGTVSNKMYNASAQGFGKKEDTQTDYYVIINRIDILIYAQYAKKILVIANLDLVVIMNSAMHVLLNL